MESYLYHSLVVRTMKGSYLDKGTYESDCSSENGEYRKQRAIIRCDENGNINEIIQSTRDYSKEQCKSLYLEIFIAASVSLVSGTIGNTRIVIIIA